MGLFKKKIRIIILTFFLSFLLFLSGRTLFIVRESKIKEYYKACASRRGKLRTAKKEKKAVTFHQERIGVIRHLWIEEDSRIMLYRNHREFYMEAVQADLVATLQSKKTSAVEIFQSPKGWFQEELYWEISSTKERVIPEKVDDLSSKIRWRYIDSEKGVVNSVLEREITSRQRVRYFDAAKADWNLITHEMVAYVVSFCLVEADGHEAKKEIHMSDIILQGTCEKMSLSFGKDSRHKRVESTGVKIQMKKRENHHL